MEKFKDKMVNLLDGFDEFQRNIRNTFQPIPTYKATTWVWIIERDWEVHKEHFGLFLEVFHTEYEITIAPCEGYNTWDPGHKIVKSFITGHNCYLAETTVIAIENLSNLGSDIFIDGSITSIAKDITRYINSITPESISVMSQINNYRDHIITDQANV